MKGYNTTEEMVHQGHDISKDTDKKRETGREGENKKEYFMKGESRKG